LQVFARFSASVKEANGLLRSVTVVASTLSKSVILKILLIFLPNQLVQSLNRLPVVTFFHTKKQCRSLKFKNQSWKFNTFTYEFQFFGDYLKILTCVDKELAS